MKRWIAFFFICFLGFSLVGKAQERVEDFVSAPLGTSVSVEAGKPVVFVPFQKKEPEEFNPQPVFWKPNLGLVQITSFAGQVLQVPNITHIPSFFIYVQVLPDASVVVTERISLILNTQQTAPFVRSYPSVFKDLNGTANFRDVKFLWARYNFEPIIPLWKQSLSEMQFSFFDDVGLSSGVHFFEVSYLIPNAVFIDGNTSRLFLPILGLKLPYLTENLQILVTYPPKTHLSSAKVFFGQNNQLVEDAYSVYQNEKEHLVYKINGVMPAFADVRLEIIGDAKSFGNQTVSEKIDEGVLNNNALVFAALVAMILYLYFHFTAWDLKDKSIESAYLAKVHSELCYDVGSLRWLVLQKADVKTVFAFVLSLFLKKSIEIHFNNQNQIILLRSRCCNRADKNILNLLMHRHLRQNVTKLRISEEKIKGFVHSFVRRQILKIVRRELFIGVLLAALSIFIVSGLNSSLTKQIIAIIVIITAFVVAFIHFIRKGEFYSLVKSSFIHYADLPRQAEKRLPFDVALDRQIADDLKIKIEDKEFLMKDFEQMFLTQLKLKGTKK